MRYVVPYSAPGIKWGQLRIDAESSAEALAKAQEIHAHTVKLNRHGSGYRGPRNQRAHYYPTMKLHKRERSQITYGEPVAQAQAGAA